VSSIKSRDRDALLQALRAGVVPRVGQQLIQVGRSRELEALIADIGRVADGGATFRLVIGEYGSGKTFFLNLVRAVGLEKKLVVLNADLNPDRRLHATGGQARSLYAELMRNAATRTKPEGGALQGIVEKFVSSVVTDARTRKATPDVVMHERMGHLSEMVGGYDFAAVVEAYWRGFETGDEALKGNAVRWLRGEFATKTDARAAVGVRTIVDDASVYDQLKLLARFVRLAGYAGLLICLDELVNLFKLTNTQARNANYEQILRILNDVMQNPPEGLGFLFGGTPEFLLDTRRGLYSYSALQSRLAENAYARQGLVDYTSPVIKLGSLSQEDFFVLLQKLRDVYASGDAKKYLVPDAALTAFMEHCQKRMGELYFRTPRTTITAFINLLAVLEQNPAAQWAELLGHVEIAKDEAPSLAESDDSASPGSPSVSPGAPSSAGLSGQDDEFATFKL
jgi:hypothetical protein